MVEVFQQFGFPIAVSIISLMAVGFLGKYLLNRMDKRDEKADKIQEQIVASLQMQNVELTGALRENAEAFKSNADAFKEMATAMNRFAAALERFESILHKLTKE